MTKTKIDWADRVWNPTTGCTKVSAGCVNCYAEAMTKRLQGMGQPKYKKGFIVTTHEDALELPLHWKNPVKIFVNSMSDLFHKDVPFDFVYKVIDVMRECPQHTFIVLTKRPHNMERFFRYIDEWGGVLPNLWLGVSVEDQKTFNERADILRQIPAAKRLISYEPAIGPISLRWLMVNPRPATTDHLEILKYIDWVIVGGESGPKARPDNPEWYRQIRDECKSAKWHEVPFFMKQMSGKKPIPEDLQIREYPDA